jgi:predicted site-specific integrase-resolvase
LHGQRIGYVRVSSFDQNPERQLEQVPVDKLFTDKASGKDTRRPELERLLALSPSRLRLAHDVKKPYAEVKNLATGSTTISRIRRITE